ncbi:MAG TPA: trypsin-like peptidase domain-containing protein [Pirellulales bacterium]|nr:trypsin-like peptidase domain-containing protein [Pirellulales bacterium]
MHCRRFFVSALGGFWVGLCLTSWGPSRALAQDESSDDLPRLESSEDEHRLEASRDKIYEALASEVTALERQSNLLKMVVKLVRPTVVHIEAEKTEAASARYGRTSHVEEAGSGFIVKLNNQFYVLTNRHVIKAATIKNIKIRLADGRQINPTRTPWSDPETDIAIMSVGAAGLVHAKLGNSDGTDIGDFVLAFGSPFGLSHSITFGIISAMGRRDLELGGDVKFKEFIQTDAAINPGNSGGPLVNLRGEVIGMNTAIASNSGGNEGIGFSIPINMVMIVARQLVQRGSVERAFLGVTLDRDFDSAMAISVGLKRPRGARIKDITPSSPAAVAKLQKGDVILEYGGVRIDNDSHLINLVSLTEVGREIPLLVFRDQKLTNVKVKLASAPSNRAARKE